MQFLADVFSLIVDPCYALTHNWWLAILLFTVIIKIILMPMALWVQKNSIVMVQLMPALNRIKIRYFGDAETIGEKQTALYKEKRYHPMLSLIPLAIQVIILFGLVDVVHGITDSGTPGTEFLGLIPVENGGLSWIMPVLAGLSAVAMGCTQNLINPLQKEQTRFEKNTTNGLSSPSRSSWACSWRPAWPSTGSARICCPSWCRSPATSSSSRRSTSTTTN